MLGTTDHTGIALAVKLDSLIREQEQRAGALAEQLAQAMHEVQRHRELRALLDQVLAEHIEQRLPADATPAPMETVASIGGGPAADAPEGPGAASTSPAGPGSADRPLEVTNPAPIEYVYRHLTEHPGQVVSSAQVREAFPGASTVQVNDRLGRLVRQGKIDRVESSRYRFPPAPPVPATPGPGSESEDDAHGTAREQIRTILEQDQGRGWRPKDIADLVKPKMNDDYLRSLLRQMVHCGELVQDNTGLYWAPRPPVIVPQRPGDRQVSMA